jgi:hypothetical protein
LRNHDIPIASSSKFPRSALALAGALALLVVACGGHDPLSGQGDGGHGGSAGGGHGGSAGGGGGAVGRGGAGGDGAGQAGAGGAGGGCAGPPPLCPGGGCPVMSFVADCTNGQWICPERTAPPLCVPSASGGACLSGFTQSAVCPVNSQGWLCGPGLVMATQCKCYVDQAGASCAGSVDASVDSSTDALSTPCPGTRNCTSTEYCVIYSGGPAPPCLPRGDGGICPDGTTPGCVSNPNGCAMLQPAVGTCVSLANCTFNSLCACVCSVGGAGCMSAAGSRVVTCGLP